MANFFLTWLSAFLLCSSINNLVSGNFFWVVSWDFPAVLVPRITATFISFCVPKVFSMKQKESGDVK